LILPSGVERYTYTGKLAMVRLMMVTADVTAAKFSAHQGEPPKYVPMKYAVSGEAAIMYCRRSGSAVRAKNRLIQLPSAIRIAPLVEFASDRRTVVPLTVPDAATAVARSRASRAVHRE
jgi:hypothetical protein